MLDFGSNHRAWQQRLGKERCPTRYALVMCKEDRGGTSSYSSNHAQAAFGQIRSSASEPSLPATSRGGTVGHSRCGQRSAPQSAAALRSGRGGGTAARSAATARGPGGPKGQGRGPQQHPARREGWLPEPEQPRARTGASQSLRRSGELVLINDGRRQAVPPTPSLRSCVTRTSVDTALWREVEQVVQAEVAKIVGPLKEQLQSEVAARARVEAALKSAGVTPKGH